MKITIHPRTYEKLLAADFSQRERREIMLDPVVDGFTQKSILRGMKRVGKSGIIDLGPGRFEGFALDRHVEIISREPGLTEVAGTVRATTGPSVLRGITFRPGQNSPALVVSSGSVFCEDCEFWGAIEVEGSGRLFLKNCLVSSEDNGIFLYEKGFAEIITSRISGQPSGIFLSKNSTCFLHHCRLESCSGKSAEEVGAGIFNSSGTLYAEGTEFFNNQVGVYLKSCLAAEFLACHWMENSISAVLSEATPANGRLAIGGSAAKSISDPTYPVIVLEGGSASFSGVRISATGHSALSAVGTSIEVDSSEFRSIDAPCVDLEGGLLVAKDSRFLSGTEPSLNLFGTSGSIAGGVIFPPPSASPRHSVAFAGVSNAAPQEPQSHVPVPRVVSMESIPHLLSGIIGQPAARSELERLLRLALAARERKRQGIQQEPPVFSGICVGPPLSGQLIALEKFAAALHELGELQSPEVLEIMLPELTTVDPSTVRAGIVMIGVDESASNLLLTPSTTENLLRFSRGLAGRAHVFLVGDRDQLHGLLRTRLELSREFSTELRFEAFSPSDLATLFVERCRREKIPLALETLKKLPVIFHGLYDRLQRRFLTVDGVNELFADTRRNYLERCSHLGNFHLELEPADIVVPLDRSIQIALARSAELVAVCPTCKGHNAWLPGLAPSLHCAHCGDEFKAPWGMLKNSTFFRRRNVPGASFRSGAVALRRTVAAIGRP
jgi:hypothetical protein